MHTYTDHIQMSVYAVYTSAMFGKLDGQMEHIGNYPFPLSEEE